MIISANIIVKEEKLKMTPRRKKSLFIHKYSFSTNIYMAAIVYTGQCCQFYFRKIILHKETPLYDIIWLHPMSVSLVRLWAFHRPSYDVMNIIVTKHHHTGVTVTFNTSNPISISRILWELDLRHISYTAE